MPIQLKIQSRAAAFTMISLLYNSEKFPHIALLAIILNVLQIPVEPFIAISRCNVIPLKILKGASVLYSTQSSLLSSSNGPSCNNREKDVFYNGYIIIQPPLHRTVSNTS